MRKTKKYKYLLSILCFLVLLISLCACGSSSDVSESDTETATRREDKKEASEESTTEVVTEVDTEEKTTEEQVTESKTEEDDFNEAEYRTDITRESFLRKPDDYVDLKVQFSGAVSSTFSEGKTSFIQVMIDEEDFYVVAYNPDILDFRILVEDQVKIYGRFTGLEEYEMAAGNSSEEPTFVADKIIVETYDEMADSPAGELRTGTYTVSEVNGEMTIEKSAEITYQDGEAYAITLSAYVPPNKELGSAFCFLTDNGDGTFTGQVDDLCTITITTYSDHFNVSYSCDEEYLYKFSGIEGDYYYE